MKFSNVLMFVSLAFAAPAVEIRQQQTVTGVVLQSVQNVAAAVDTNVDAIKSAVQGITGSVSAEVEAQLRANLRAILDSIKSSTATIVGATTGAAGGIIGAAINLSQQQIDDLALAVKTATDAIAELEVIVSASATDLTPAVRTLLNDQITAIKDAISPFASPIVNFSRAVAAFSARVGVTVTGLARVTSSLANYTNSLLISLGLGPLLDFIFSKRANL